MPNWCDNTAHISNIPQELFDKIKTAIESGKEDTGLFSLVKPMPKDEQDWWTWNINNWGCKWDVDLNTYCQYDDDNRSIDWTFDTAWSPPVALYDYMYNELGCHVDAKYFESGMDFIGEYCDGIDSTWSSSPDESGKFHCPQRLVDYFDLAECYEVDSKDYTTIKDE